MSRTNFDWIRFSWLATNKIVAGGPEDPWILGGSCPFNYPKSDLKIPPWTFISWVSEASAILDLIWK